MNLDISNKIVRGRKCIKVFKSKIVMNYIKGELLQKRLVLLGFKE